MKLIISIIASVIVGTIILGSVVVLIIKSKTKDK